MAPSLRERISGVDTAWLRMDSPESPMTIVGVFAFQARLDGAAVKRAISSRFLAYHRFRSYPTEDATGAWWKVSHDFDLDEHVVRARLPGKAGKRELERFVSRLASTPLARGRPLWQYHLVENYEGGSALVARIHHCYADGIALVRVILSLTDTSAPASLAAPEGPADGEAAPEGDLWAQAFGPVSRLLAEGLQSAVGKGIDIAAESAKLALMGRDSPTRLKGPLATTKRVAWADPLPLDEVKAIAKAMDCSVNDLLVSMAAGALREYLRAKGDAVDGIEVRAIVPVNLRPVEEAARLGNQFGMVFLELPIGIEHPLERLYEVRRRMAALKRSYQPAISLALLRAVGSGPKAMQDQVTGFLGKNASLVVTNVPGPQHPLYFAGQRIAELEFWVPQSAGIGLGLSLLSYDGKVQFGVMGDAGRVPDPRRIAERFGGEFTKLMWITLMSPWAGDAAAPSSARVRDS